MNDNKIFIVDARKDIVQSAMRQKFLDFCALQ